MPLPHPHLIVLRSAATVVLSCLIAQAGWAAAMLGDDPGYRWNHRVGAWVTLVICLLSALVYLVLRRSAGPVNVTMALLLAAGVAVQFFLGATDREAVHIFLGVLLAMLGTALTSWTYRHSLPVAAG
ncbi:hypothetical protein GA0111570_106118 [Raineyella antarctica]|uniref:Uncharacterized protein n=1 Tax=Raineyella antarctica TaxID=1577474 RepID=A0A1G6H3J5_9ACTN|nr:hypothetical protein [Raineyella antarctica]SDB88724.1 hypothetical protein GA0111570_106118 [Raineyella antarctica]